MAWKRFYVSINNSVAADTIVVWPRSFSLSTDASFARYLLRNQR